MACPTPEKVAYTTKTDALDAWRQIRRQDRRLGRGGKRRKAKDLTPYRCVPDIGGCGLWHLGRRKRTMRT